MQAEDYKYTVTIRQDAWFIRLYAWLWKAEPRKADICKLFWGYVFFLPNLIARLLWLLLWPVRQWFLAAAEEDERKQARKRAEPPKEDIPGRIALFFARPWPRRVSRIFMWVVFGVCGLAILSAAVWGLMLLAPLLPGAFLAVWKSDAPLVVGLVVGWLLAIGLFAWVADRFKWAERSERRKRGKRERGDLTFGDMLVQGARAVKTNTCPRVEVIEHEADRG